MVLLVGCRAPGVMEVEYPGDLALVVTVQPGLYAGTDDPTRAPAQYVVQSDRTLRVAWGPAVRHDLYPPTTTAVLHPREMARLHGIVEEHELMAAESAARNEQDEAWYQVEITAGGRTHRYVTSPGESRGTVVLVRTLAGLYRGR
ncbi:MAG: hypothetical protein ACODAQ_09600 [Phycisphaeraceae bacterium]